MSDWKEKIATQLLPDLKDQRIRELELEVGRLMTENKNLRGKLSAKGQQAAAHRERETAQLVHSRHKAIERRGHVEALLEAAQAENADLKKRMDKARKALEG